MSSLNQFRAELRRRFIAAKERGVKGYSEELSRIEGQLMSAAGEELNILLEHHRQISRAVGVNRIYRRAGALQ